MRFSEYYELNKTQLELDFVDVPINEDINLCVDPYAISNLDSSDWFINANNEIIDFFNLLLTTVKSGDKKTALRMLQICKEPKGTGLGFSKSGDGLGMGIDYANKLYQALRESRLTIDDNISDIGECELFVEGMGSDRISDMTIGILKKRLIGFTQNVCRQYNIEMRRGTAMSDVWNPETMRVESGYYDMPVINNIPRILIPKLIVRYRMSYDNDKFYNSYVLDFLKAEHESANTSLVEMLKNGKKRVLKKTLKQQPTYKKTKKFLYDMSKKYPNILDNYKNDIKKKDEYVYERGLDELNPAPPYFSQNDLIEKLKAIPVGQSNAGKYHDTIFDIIKGLFMPSLIGAVKEEEINEGRKRIDIVANNVAREGFFFRLTTHYRVSCPFILIECKNYSEDIANPEIDQMLGRFSDKRGNFGIICCRGIDNQDKLLKKCKDILHDHNKYIIVLTDDDIINLINNRFNKGSGLDTRMDEILDEKMKTLVM